ncbi:Pycsar system effector family protein [Streptomyces sp. NPDC002851]
MSTTPTPTTPRPTAATTEATAAQLLTDLRAEIARADSKAAVLVAALGMTAGVLSGLLAGRSWSPGDLGAAGAVTWWAGALALALALFALLMAVVPRYGGDTWTPGRPLTYFDDIQRAARQGELAAALEVTAGAPTAGLLAALTANSRIAARKHLWIRAGLLAFATGAVLLPGALLIG